jgi:hypothetical protein
MSTRVWVWIKRIGYVVAIAGGVIAAWTTLRPLDEYRLRASGHCSRVTLPESLIEDTPGPSRNTLKLMESIWWITVRNTGRKEVQDLSIELPFDGLYQVEKMGATSVVTNFQRIVDVGSLRSANEVTVIVWAGPAFFPRSTWCARDVYGQTRVTHPDGVVRIQYTETVSGFQAWWSRYGIWMVLGVTGTAGLILLSVPRSTEGKLASKKVQCFVVDATREEGIDTGVSLEVGQRMTIVGDGEVTIDKGHVWMNPDGEIVKGNQKGTIRLWPGTQLDDEPGGGALGALIGWIGDDRAETSFRVGKLFTGKAKGSGSLHLGVNDEPGAFSDNTASDGTPTSFHVTVIVE